MARLDAEAAAAVVRPLRIPTTAEARAYLEELQDLCARTSDAGRHAIAEAVFERIDVLGATDFTFTLTAAAKARGWDAAFGPGVVRLEHQGGRGKTSRPGKVATCPETGDSEHEEGQSGRGERSQTSGTDLFVPGWSLTIRVRMSGSAVSDDRMPEVRFRIERPRVADWWSLERADEASRRGAPV